VHLTDRRRASPPLPLGKTPPFESQMDTAAHRRLVESITDVLLRSRFLDEVAVFDALADEAHRIDEGKWIRTKTSNTMRIDHATHGAGQTHAHIYGRKNNQLGIVNIDGTGSHGTQMRLTKDDAETLRQQGFIIPASRMVEWVVRPEWTPELLFG
jgi:hypothetical protein